MIVRCPPVEPEIVGGHAGQEAVEPNRLRLETVGVEQQRAQGETAVDAAAKKLLAHPRRPPLKVDLEHGGQLDRLLAGQRRRGIFAQTKVVPQRPHQGLLGQVPQRRQGRRAVLGKDGRHLRAGKHAGRVAHQPPVVVAANLAGHQAQVGRPGAGIDLAQGGLAVVLMAVDTVEPPATDQQPADLDLALGHGRRLGGDFLAIAADHLVGRAGDEIAPAEPPGQPSTPRAEARHVGPHPGPQAMKAGATAQILLQPVGLQPCGHAGQRRRPNELGRFRPAQ